MTNEELEKELTKTQAALQETQVTLKTTIAFVGRLKNVLKVNRVFDDLDMSYIKGEISEAEYVNQIKAQNALVKSQNACSELGDLFMAMFGDVSTKE